MPQSEKYKVFKIAIRWIVGLLISIVALLFLADRDDFRDRLWQLTALFGGLILIPPIFRFCKRYFKPIIILLLALFLFYNPGLTAFKDYVKDPSDKEYTIYRREANYLLFSVYTKSHGDDSEKYVGILGNFYEW